MGQSTCNSQVEEQFPKDREQYALETVGQDSGLETTSKEAEEAFSLYNNLCSLSCSLGKVLVSKTSTKRFLIRFIKRNIDLQYEICVSLTCL